jgi:hypothetical protein
MKSDSTLFPESQNGMAQEIGGCIKSTNKSTTAGSLLLVEGIDALNKEMPTQSSTMRLGQVLSGVSKLWQI